MGLTFTLLLAAALSASAPSLAADDWTRIWSLCRSASGDPASSEALSQLLKSAPLGVRLDVAKFHLSVANGGTPGPVPCQGLPELSSGGAWAFCLALEDGEELDSSLVQALAEGPEFGDMRPVLQRGYERFLSHTDSASAAEAVALAEALHDRARAVWTGMNLAIARTRLGAYEAASLPLRGLLQGDLNASDRVTIKSRLSLVYLGSGGLLRARGQLGAGLTEGAGDSRIVLGLIALERARWDRSKALFRSALAGDPSQAWAGRGWGLSMVPRPRSLTQ